MRYRGHASGSPKSGRRFIKPWPASLKLTANLRFSAVRYQAKCLRSTKFQQSHAKAPGDSLHRNGRSSRRSPPRRQGQARRPALPAIRSKRPPTKERCLRFRRMTPSPMMVRRSEARAEPGVKLKASRDGRPSLGNRNSRAWRRRARSPCWAGCSGRGRRGPKARAGAVYPVCLEPWTTKFQPWNGRSRSRDQDKLLPSTKLGWRCTRKVTWPLKSKGLISVPN
jgi:hypothetical protein